MSDGFSDRGQQRTGPAEPEGAFDRLDREAGMDALLKYLAGD
jgi:hypothetical protein